MVTDTEERATPEPTLDVTRVIESLIIDAKASSMTASRSVGPSAAPPRRRGRHHRFCRYICAVVEYLRLPEPLIERSRPNAPTTHDSAAALGVWMRRRDDPNP